jgi:hypothetical protein
MTPGPLAPEVVKAWVDAQQARWIAEGKPAHLEDDAVIDLVARIVAGHHEGQAMKPGPRTDGRRSRPKPHRTQGTT